MKHFLLSCLIFISSIASAQTDSSFRWALKLLPQQFIVKRLTAGGEFFNHDKSKSVQLLVSAVANNYGQSDWDVLPYNGGGVEIGYRNYITPLTSKTNKKGRAIHRGIYLSGFVRGGFYKGSFKGEDTQFNFDPSTSTWIRTTVLYDYTSTIKNGSLGFTFGIHHIFLRVISFDTFLGAGFAGRNMTTTGQVSESVNDNFIGLPNYRGFFPTGGISVGLCLR